MVIPSVTQVLSWNPEPLRALGSEWAAGATTAGERVVGAGNATTDSYTYWGPGAGDAMRDHVHEIIQAGKKLATILSDGCATLDIHRSRLQATVDAAAAAIRSATSSGFTVADDGTVTPPAVIPDASDPSGSRIVVQMAGLRKRAEEFAGIITRHLAAVGIADDDASASITQICADIQRTAGLDPGLATAYTSLAVADGVADGAAARDRRLAPDDYRRIGAIVAAIQLSPAQLDALARGDTVDTVPPSAMNYLRDFYREAGTTGLLDIAANLRTREHSGDPHAAAQLDALANGLLTLSNENIGDGRTTGGYDLLPDDLKDTLSRINAPADQGLMGNFYNDIYTEKRAPAVADLLAEANPGFVPGTEFASELDRAASRLVDISMASGGLYGEKYDPIAEQFLEIGTRNETASYELLTSPDNGRTLMPLLEYDWRDDGATAGRLVDWIADDAIVTDPDDITRADRAGHAAYALAVLMSSSGSDTPLGFDTPSNTNPYDRLMNIPGAGDGRSSLGEVNPALTQSIAASLSPYVVDMVTSDRTLSTTSGFGNLGPVETTRLFSVLDGDPRAGTVISGHALAAADEIDRAFARSDRVPPPIMLGETSGRLRAAVEGGLDIEIGDRVHDLDERKAERATTRAGFFGAAQAIGAGALSYLPPPWGVAASTGTYAVGSFLASDIIDAGGNLTDAYTQSPQARFRLDAGEPGTPAQTQVTDNEISYNMFAELVETGRIPITAVPETMRNDGGVITYAELIEKESAGDFDSSRTPGLGRQILFERMPEYLNDAGLRSAEGYRHQHSIAVGAYHNMIFGRVNGDGTFDAAIRGSGNPTAMSRWPV